MKRKLKVEELGARYKPASRPASIRLKGQWLRAAGFTPGATVDLTVISPGVIEIRISPPVKLGYVFERDGRQTVTVWATDI